MVLGFQCIQMGLSQGATPRCDARSCGRGCGCWFLVLGCWAGGRILADSDHACECETSMLRGAQVHALVQVLKRLSSAPGECIYTPQDPLHFEQAPAHIDRLGEPRLEKEEST